MSGPLLQEEGPRGGRALYRCGLKGGALPAGGGSTRPNPGRVRHTTVPSSSRTRNMQAVAAGQLRVESTSSGSTGGSGTRRPSCSSSEQHLLAQPAVLAVQQGQLQRFGSALERHRGRRPTAAAAATPHPIRLRVERRRRGRRPPTDCSEFAMARTVSGGTSPTAVILRPSTTVEIRRGRAELGHLVARPPASPASTAHPQPMSSTHGRHSGPPGPRPPGR